MTFTLLTIKNRIYYFHITLYIITFCIIYRILSLLFRCIEWRFMLNVVYVKRVMFSQRVNCKLFIMKLFLTIQRIKNLYYPTFGYSVLNIMRSEMVVERERKGGSSASQNEERMTQRNGVSKEGARRASDRPHNTLARDDPPWIYARVKVTMDASWYAVPCTRLLRAATATSEIEKERTALANSTENPTAIPRLSQTYVSRTFLRFIFADSYFPF